MTKSEERFFKRVVTRINEDLPYIPIGYMPCFFTFGGHVKGSTTDSDGHFRYGGGGLNYTWLERRKR